MVAGWLPVCDALGQQSHPLNEEEVALGQAHFSQSAAIAL